jgi:hypothetical protein
MRFLSRIFMPKKIFLKFFLKFLGDLLIYRILTDPKTGLKTKFRSKFWKFRNKYFEIFIVL